MEHSNQVQQLNQAIEFNKSIINQLEEINAPLIRNFGIYLFTYRRLNKDGTLLHITTQKNWIEQSVKKNLLISSEIGPKIVQTINTSKQNFIWSGNLKDSLYSSLYEFNIWNGITFYQNYENYIEIIAFATAKDNYQALNFYINNLDLLEHFKAYFKEKASNIISSQAFKKLSIDVHEKIPIFNSNKSIQDKHFQFFNETQLTRYYFSGKYEYIYLTRREAEVLFYLTQGKTCKYIAKILKTSSDKDADLAHTISERTVETYWNAIKAKFQICDKTKIIDIFLESDIYNQISYWHKVCNCKH